MITFLSLVFFFNAHACHFSDQKKIYSLSSVVSVLLRDLNLINSNQVLGISDFSPIDAPQTKRIAGGIYLSQQVISSWDKSIIFFDESKELQKKLIKQKKLELVEIKTRGKLITDIYSELKMLITHHTVGCHKKIDQIFSSYLQDLKNLNRNFHFKAPIIFYLGPSLLDKFPELVIVNDGAIGELIKRKRINSYPSNLSYLPWSMKVIESMPKRTLHISLVDSKEKNEIKLVKKKEYFYEFFYPGILSPGPTQVRGLLELKKKLFFF